MRLGASLNSVAQEKRKTFASKKQSSSDSNSSQRVGRLQRRPSFHQKEEKKDAHPITLAVQNNYPQIAEMILRQMTLEEAVNGTHDAKPRAAESQSLEPKPTQDLVQSVSMRLSRERKR